MSEADFDEAPTISPDTFHEKLIANEPLTLLDIRDRDEVDAWQIEGESVTNRQAAKMEFVSASANGTVEDLATDLDLHDPVVVICAKGKSSDRVAALLNEAGYDAQNLAGGMEAWARLYRASDLETKTALVRQYYRPASGCCTYLIASGDEAVVVDPLRLFVDRYVADAQDLDVTITAVDTHVHADHLSGGQQLASETGTTPILPQGALDRGLAFDAETVDDGDEIVVGDTALKVIHAPGHTTEMIVFQVDDLLLTGDSLFLQSVARPDLERGSEGAQELAGTLHETLQNLLELPPDTRIAPGHMEAGATPSFEGAYLATLADLRERLDVLDLSRGAFVDRILDDLPPQPANYEQIIDVNLGRKSINSEDAFELELGPNNCAVST